MTDDLPVRIDQKTGLVGRALQVPRSDTWKLVPLDAHNNGRLAFLRKEKDLRQVTEDDQLYEVSIDFYKDDELYGEMTVHIVASDLSDLRVLAEIVAAESVFDDERIPDRHPEFDYELDDTLRDEIVGSYNSIAGPTP